MKGDLDLESEPWPSVSDHAKGVPGALEGACTALWGACAVLLGHFWHVGWPRV